MESTTDRIEPFTLDIQWHQRVWGGNRLSEPVDGIPIGEAWVVHDENRVVSGPLAGLTLAEVTERFTWSLLGAEAERRADPAFPLLIKLLDTADWLSIQVHPDDWHAAELEGPGYRGKTEAWYLLDAEPGAELIAGVRPGVQPQHLVEAIHDGTIGEIVERHPVGVGDGIFVPAGAIHALGPGLLIYEVQQSSDLTYRVFDWNRPVSTGRALHLDKSAAVARVEDQVTLFSAPNVGDGEVALLLESEFFVLRLLSASDQAIELDPKGETFHAITVVEGNLAVEYGGASTDMGPWQSMVVPASAGAYRIIPRGRSKALIASLV